MRRVFMSVLVVVLAAVSVAWIGVANQARAGSATPVVYVATGENFPDALGAAAAASVQGGPVLLVTKTAIPAETKAELVRLAPDVIYVAGGTAVVSDTVFNALKAYAGSVVRVAGPNRYSTAVEVSKSAFPITAGGGDTAALEAAVAALTARLDVFETSGKVADSDKLDGKDSTAFLAKAVYDTDEDGVVDSAEVKIRYSDDDFTVDMSDPAPDRMRCVTAPVAFSTTTTVVTAGGLSLLPRAVPPDYDMWGDVYYSTDAGVSWAIFDNLSLEDTHPDGTGHAAIALNAVKTLDAGTYIFAIQPFGYEILSGYDYSGYCQLTMTAYTGLGATTDVVISLSG